MKIILIILAVVIVLGLVYVIFVQTSKPRKSDYEDRAVPLIVEKDDVTVLKVSFDGDPDKVISAAYKDLFKAYYQCKGVPKGPKQAPPLARYEGFDDKLLATSEEELKSKPWKGFVAIPVPAGTLLPQKAPETVSLSSMTYGTVAEIIHFGPYETEHEKIRVLQEFIREQGYEIDGLHEEEYILGPGTPLSKPADYITVIRYQVKKK